MRLSVPAKHKPTLFYLAASLLIFLPLLNVGYILVLDMVFAPTIPMPRELTNTYPFYMLLHALHFVIPAFIIQKMLLISIFAIAGLGTFRLFRVFRPTTVNTTIWQWAAYFAGIFYMYNPFTYTRLMAGQYLVLVGYALLPFFVRALWNFVQQPDRKGTLILAGFTTGIAVTSVHTLGIALIVAFIAVIVQALSRAGRRQHKSLVAHSLLGVSIVIVLNSFWLIPVIRGSSELTDTVANFSSADFEAFATTSGDFGTIVNVLSLQGFWGDDKNLYLLPQDISGLWLLPLAVVWALVLLGCIWSWRNQRKLGFVLAATGIAGLILACGTSGTVFSGLNGWLATHVPFFAAYREPQKFAMLIVLAYAYFAGAGLAWLASYVKQTRQRQTILILALLLPLACAPLLPWGATNQLRAKTYPLDWHSVNTQINAERQPEAKALFLPWHLYMPLRFSNGVVANPAEAFFDIPILSSKDPELGRAGTYKIGSDITAAGQLIGNAANEPRLVPRLATLGIRYIIVAKEFDFARYDFLQSNPDLHQLTHSESLIVYKISVKQ